MYIRLLLREDLFYTNIEWLYIAVTSICIILINDSSVVLQY